MMLRDEVATPKIQNALVINCGMALRVIFVRIMGEGLAAYLQEPSVIVLLDPLQAPMTGHDPICAPCRD